jgi:hypothetical protein
MRNSTTTTRAIMPNTFTQRGVVVVIASTLLLFGSL